MAFATILSINFNLLLAQRRFKLLSSVLICSLLYVFAVHLDHHSAYRIIWYEGIAIFVALLVTTIGILGPTGKVGSEE